MEKLTRVKYLALVAAFVIVAAGCGGPAARRAPEPGPMRNDQNQGQMNRQMDGQTNMMAEQAVRISERERDVERAHAVVHDSSTLLVGIMLRENVSEEEKRRIERDLEDKISSEVNGINRVMVTSENEHVSRIRDIERDVTSGKALSELREDTRDVFDRITMRR